MKILSTVVLILGIALGPIYFGYTKFFSEKEYGKHEIINKDISLQTINGKQQYFSHNEEWNMPCYLKLSPKMNPITFTAEIRHLPLQGNQTKSAHMIGGLSLNNVYLWQKDFSIPGNSRHSSDQRGFSLSINSSRENLIETHLQTFKIKREATYKFYLTEQGSANFPMQNISIVITGNHTKPNMTIVFAGLGIIVLSILGLLMNLLLKKA